MEKVLIVFRIFFAVVLALLFMGGSSLPPADELERVRRNTRTIEFDYVDWTLEAMGGKLKQSALSMPDYVDGSMQTRFVLETLKLVEQINITNAAIEQIYSDPSIDQPDETAAPLLKKLEEYRAIMQKAGPMTESIIEGQITTVLNKHGLTVAGQPFPPVSYHVTPLPLALIVSPRGVIRQDANISLNADLTTPEIQTLEEQVEAGVGKSALVVEIGGVGIYPTMVMNTSDLNYLVETVAHEWIHNYLTLRPLGLNYETTPELRTMNETAASIAGKELGREVLKEFYPDKVPPEEPLKETAPGNQDDENGKEDQPAPTEPAGFDFREEMHETRVNADAMLAEGKIEEAETYMESRRAFLWENGYQIRKLNQAYFAFYGAYAASPGGAAGEDPVGPAVRALRGQSASLTDFINRISWMTSFDELKAAIEESGGG